MADTQPVVTLLALMTGCATYSLQNILVRFQLIWIWNLIVVIKFPEQADYNSLQRGQDLKMQLAYM